MGRGVYGHLLVRYRDGCAQQVKDYLSRLGGVEVRYEMPNIDAISVSLPDGRTYPTAAKIAEHVDVLDIEDNLKVVGPLGGLPEHDDILRFLKNHAGHVMATSFWDDGTFCVICRTCDEGWVDRMGDDD